MHDLRFNELSEMCFTVKQCQDVNTSYPVTKKARDQVLTVKNVFPDRKGMTAAENSALSIFSISCDNFGTFLLQGVCSLEY